MSGLAVVNPVLAPASPQAQALSHLIIIALIVCGVIFAIVAALTAWCILRFRDAGNAAEPRQVAGNTKLEFSWTLASIAVLVFLFVFTVRAMGVSDPPADRDPDFTVVAHQWWWEVRYPGGATTANEIHMPAQTDVLVRIESADVIHSFWVPQLGRKVDAIPGHPNHVWIRADEPGVYLGACSEFCGAQHAWMRIRVVVLTPEKYQRWLTHQATPASIPLAESAARGLDLFQKKTCVNCHAVRGINENTRVGPDLTHFASRESLGSGILGNDPANLRRWLQNPQDVKPGCHMPNFHLEDREVDDLVAFIETLK